MLTNIDWFLEQSEQHIESAEFNIEDLPDEDILTHIETSLLAAWALWFNVYMITKIGVISLNQDQQYRLDYLKMKFVQHSRFLPEQTSSLSI